MAEIKFEKEQLDNMLASVASELTEMLKAESAQLAKGAKEDAPAEESEGSEGPAAPPAEESAAEGPPAEASAPPAEASAPPAEASAPPAAAAPPPGAEASAPAPGQDSGEIEPAPTVEALQAEYQKLDPEALKMHFLACKSALMAAMGADQGAGAPPEASAPAGAPPPAPSASPAHAPMAMGEKGGKKVVLGNEAGNGGKMEAGKLGKAEAEVADLKKQVAAQNEALGNLSKAVETFLQPVRKSVKGVSDLRFVARTEEPKASPVGQLSKKEITAKLREKARDSKLSKSDKDLISSYAVGGVDVSKIEHLLKDAV